MAQSKKVLSQFVLMVIGSLMILAPVPGMARARSRTVQLTVSAAVSLSESLRALKDLYQQQNPGTSIVLNLGASGILQQQIEEGAPADIFISASVREMNELQKKGLLLPGTRRDLLGNTLVLICPAYSRGISSFKDLTLPQVKRVAIANPESVPAGMYAKQTLEYFKIYGQLRSKIIRAGDVRQALAYVETGDADAGIVYLTDARHSSKVRVIAIAPESSHTPIVYPIAAIKRSLHPSEAEDFIRFITGPAGQQIFKKEGFEPGH